MEHNKNYYLLQIIEMGEESKKTINLDTSIVESFKSDEHLGKEVRRLIEKKILDCNEQIKNAKNLIK